MGIDSTRGKRNAQITVFNDFYGFYKPSRVVFVYAWHWVSHITMGTPTENLPVGIAWTTCLY